MPGHVPTPAGRSCAGNGQPMGGAFPRSSAPGDDGDTSIAFRLPEQRAIGNVSVNCHVTSAEEH